MSALSEVSQQPSRRGPHALAPAEADALFLFARVSARGLDDRPDGTGGRVRGPSPDHATYSSFATFNDPDGNGWLLQEVTTRLPGRIEAATTSFASASDLASALQRAEAAHGQHEKRTGKRDENWPDWYASYMVAEQAGTELPT